MYDVWEERAQAETILCLRLCSFGNSKLALIQQPNVDRSVQQWKPNLLPALLPVSVAEVFEVQDYLEAHDLFDAPSPSSDTEMPEQTPDPSETSLEPTSDVPSDEAYFPALL